LSAVEYYILNNFVKEIFMPKVYLSPSLQEFNPYIDGGNEEYYMNLIADAMEPYLRASGIEFVRNQPDMSLSQAIADSNNSGSELHLAIHSNAAPASAAGQYTGADIYYYPSSTQGKRFADILKNNYTSTYYEPDDIDTIPTTSLAEVRRTTAPTALIEVGYHDNPEEANWIRDNIQNIARSLSKSVADYFGVPFVEN
jgi:N-acetylmuramoyl-L-alanine amidase